LVLIESPLYAIAFFEYCLLTSKFDSTCQVGIGLDDTFIICNAFSRTDPSNDVVDRIVEVIEGVGSSIFVSTLSTLRFSSSAV